MNVIITSNCESLLMELEQISYKWEEIRQICSYAVAVPYFAVAISIHCDSTRHMKQWKAI
jgi:hypothetical protein